MGELFDKVLRSDESLFLNSQFLDYDYQPKLVQFREMHQKHIATCIQPLLQRRNGKNILIFGKPGVGKTVSLKHVLNELKEDYGDEAYCLYVNCWKRDTSFKVISEICQQINYKWTHNKNFDELMASAAEIINEKSAVIILDEADKLQEQNIIYNILEDVHRRCIILITNDENFVNKLDSRIKSRLLPDLLEFKPYNLNETEAILKQRTEYAFIPDCLDKTAFDSVVKKTFELKDIRSGLFLLKQAGEVAENKSLRKITINEVKNAITSLATLNLDEDADLIALISILKENSGKSKREIFKVFEEKANKSQRTFQRKMKELEDDGKIKVTDTIGDFGKEPFIEFLD